MVKTKKKASEIIFAYIREHSQAKDLPQTKEIAAAFVPKSLINRVERKILASGVKGDFSAEGFINFLLGETAKLIDYYVDRVLTVLSARSAYESLLSDLRETANLTPAKTTAMYVSADAAQNRAGDALSAMFDFMPEKIVIEITKDFKNYNFINSVQYIFGEKVKLVWRGDCSWTR
ncbi:hypothetical protein FACS189490_01490 [Clostridia bacterium]|nr:hypothetical protein FACS189490_01490 [Clostridia bacterium]